MKVYPFCGVLVLYKIMTKTCFNHCCAQRWFWISSPGIMGVAVYICQKKSPSLFSFVDFFLIIFLLCGHGLDESSQKVALYLIAYRAPTAEVANGADTDGKLLGNQCGIPTKFERLIDDCVLCTKFEITHLCTQCSSLSLSLGLLLKS